MEKNIKKILKTEDAEQRNWEFDCLMREERSKIYILQQSKPEYLLYDFGLAAGESMEAFDGYIPLNSYVDEIEDVVINGVDRKVYSISMSSGETQRFPAEKWILGIGSTAGLKRQSCQFYTGCNVYSTLLCVTQDGKEIYHSPDFAECYYRVFDVGIQEVSADLIDVYPNPNNGVFIIKVSQWNEPMPINIYSVSGEWLYSDYLMSSETTIALPLTFKQGFYLLEIGKEQKEYKKILVR